LATLSRQNPWIDWESRDRNHLILPLRLQTLQLLVLHPMNAIHWTHIDRLLDHLLRISILTNDPRATIVRLNVKSVPRNMGTVFAADTSQLIHIDPFLPENTA
jgi:hypothetical protein